MEPEYAPEYTAREKWRHIAILAPLMLGLFALFQWWLLPMWKELAEHAPCRRVLGLPALDVVLYASFVGIPLLAGLSALLATGGLSLRAIRARRFPPPGQKVYRRTPVRTGWRALAIAAAPLVVAGLLFGLGAWGARQAQALLEQMHRAHPDGWHCAAADAMPMTDPGPRSRPARLLGRDQEVRGGANAIRR